MPFLHVSAITERSTRWKQGRGQTLSSNATVPVICQQTVTASRRWCCQQAPTNNKFVKFRSEFADTNNIHTKTVLIQDVDTSAYDRLCRVAFALISRQARARVQTVQRALGGNETMLQTKVSNFESSMVESSNHKKASRFFHNSSTESPLIT